MLSKWKIVNKIEGTRKGRFLLVFFSFFDIIFILRNKARFLVDAKDGLFIEKQLTHGF